MNRPGERYDHLQIGYALLAMVFVAWVSMLISCVRYRMPAAALLFTVLLFFLGSVFFALRVTVDDAAVRLKFGTGVIRKEIQLSQILSCIRVRNSVLSGWGIRRIRRAAGWLYSVSGFDAVELSLPHNRVVRIGTDDPEGLLAAIQSRIG